MRITLYLLLAFAIILTDQASKWMVMEQILAPQRTEITQASPPGFLDWYKNPPIRHEPAEIAVTQNFNLVTVWNKGVSFGMFNQTSDYGPMILVGLSLTISLFFLLWLARAPDTMQSSGIAFVIGGALGNVVDRLRYGAVFDFLDIHAFDYHWPAFNIADSAIVIGVGVLIIHSFFFDKKYKGHAHAK